MLVIMERFGHTNVGVGTDEVAVAVPIPAEGRVVQTSVQGHMVVTGSIDVLDVVAYGVHNLVVPLIQPNNGDVIDTIWDQLVPKSNATLTFDLGEELADTEARWEPGQEVVGNLLDIQIVKPMPVYERRKLISFASVQTGFTPGTPDTYRPTDRFQYQVNRSFYCPRESALMYGLSSPDWVEAVTNLELLPTGTLTTTQEWALLKYLDKVVEDMMWDMIGAITGGTQEIYTEATTFLENLLSDFGKVQAAEFTGATWSATVVMTAGIVVPGQLEKQVVSAR